MRWIFIMGMMSALGGCVPARMAGFDTLRARGDLDPIEVTGVAGWSDGSFRLGDDAGSVRRLAQADAIGWGPDAVGSAFDAVRVGLAARYGTMEFALSRADLGGRLEGRCRHARTEVRHHVVGVEVTDPGRPLRLRCAYRIDGRGAGSLDLVATASPSGSMAEPRIGVVRVDGRELAIRSRHAIRGTSLAAAEPIGYVLDTSDGVPVAAVEISGATRRRLLLPRSSPDRVPAVAALLTLALFRDPGDVG